MIDSEFAGAGGFAEGKGGESGLASPQDGTCYQQAASKSLVTDKSSCTQEKLSLCLLDQLGSRVSTGNLSLNKKSCIAHDLSECLILNLLTASAVVRAGMSSYPRLTKKADLATRSS